jgi:hypothetical protein
MMKNMFWNSEGFIFMKLLSYLAKSLYLGVIVLEQTRREQDPPS